jgi:hypothetical protein
MKLTSEKMDINKAPPLKIRDDPILYVCQKVFTNIGAYFKRV